MPKPTRVTNRVRELRRTHGGISQAQLASEIGVSRQTVNAIEQARYSPSLEVAFKIALVFETTLDKVFEYSGDR